MNRKGNTGIRLLFYLGGLLIITMGVAISVKSDLGVAPLSSIPYTMTCVAGIELGKATIMFNTFLVFCQILLLRKQFQIYQLLQIPVGILFGSFVSFCCHLMSYVPDTSNMVLRIVLVLISTTVVAIGVFLYVPAGFIPLGPEGAMLAVSRITGIEFPNVKLAADIFMVAISLVTCLVTIHRLGSVGIGTVLSALLVGTQVKLLTKWFGNRRDQILGFTG